MKQKWIYLLKNNKTGETIWALSHCSGWIEVLRQPYYFTQSGLC